MAKTLKERQEKLRDRVRAGELHLIRMYVQPSVYQALQALTGGEHGKTYTEVMSNLILNTHSNVMALPATKPKASPAPAKKKELSVQERMRKTPLPKLKKTVTTVRGAGQVYDITWLDPSQRMTLVIGIVSKSVEGHWTASTHGDPPYFQGRTRRGAVDKWLDHFVRS